MALHQFRDERGKTFIFADEVYDGYDWRYPDFSSWFRDMVESLCLREGTDYVNHEDRNLGFSESALRKVLDKYEALVRERPLPETNDDEENIPILEKICYAGKEWIKAKSLYRADGKNNQLTFSAWCKKQQKTIGLYDYEDLPEIGCLFSLNAAQKILTQS